MTASLTTPRPRAARLLTLLTLLTVLAALVTSCSSGGSSAGSNSANTGTLAIKLRHDSPSLKQFDLAPRKLGNEESEPYINRLLVKFYEDAGDHLPGTMLFERDEEVQPQQDTVLLEDIPAPQDYFIVVDIYYSDSDTPYASVNFLASVLPGVTTQATSLSAVQVGMNVIAENSTLPKGGSTFCDAYAIFNDGTSQLCNSAVKWTVSDPEVCALSLKDERACLRAQNPGTTQVQANDGNFTASTDIAVSDKEISFLLLEPAEDVAIQVGNTNRYMAIAFYTDDTHEDVTASATWIVSDPQIALFTENGIVQGIAEGECTVRASWAGWETSSSRLIVMPQTTTLLITPRSQRVSVGSTCTFQAFTPAGEVTAYATWEASNANATLLEAGVFQGIETGPCTVTATYNGETATAELTVTNEPQPTPTPTTTVSN